MTANAKISQAKTSFLAIDNSAAHKQTKQDVQKNIRNMKDSHFAIGLTPGSNFQKAPYKVSNPIGHTPHPPYDKNKLRQESWTLGSYPETFNTVTKVQYPRPIGANPLQGQEYKTLKARVGASSVNTRGPDKDSLFFSTTTGAIHKSF